MEQQQIPQDLHKATPFYLLCPLPVLIICSILCLCVCVFFLIPCVCAYIYSFLSDLTCDRSVIEKVAQSALGRSCYCHNLKLFAEVGDCLQPSAWGDSFSPATTKRGNNETPLVISIAPTGSICFDTIAMATERRLCRNKENNIIKKC